MPISDRVSQIVSPLLPLSRGRSGYQSEFGTFTMMGRQIDENSKVDSDVQRDPIVVRMPRFDDELVQSNST